MTFFKNIFFLLFLTSGFLACSDDENEVLLDDGLNSTETFFKVRFINNEFVSEENFATINNSSNLTLIALKRRFI